jgi:uncharacterized membrane protein
MRFASLAIVLIAIALSVIFYPRLPDPMPSHWNAAGEADGWSSKPAAMIFLPLIMAGTLGLFAALRSEVNARAYRIVEFSTLAFLLCVHVMALLMATGTRLNATFTMTALVGALFVVLGMSMTSMRPNFIIGIRTPWTLASEDVWDRTHRLGATTFAIAGVLLMIVPFGGLATVVVAFPIIAIVATVIPIVYSYVIYRRLERLVDRTE